MGNFGLGLVLSFTDNASAGINSAVNSLNQLTSTAESASNSLNNIASLSALSAVSGQLGNMFTTAGNGIINAFSGIINRVQDTGQEFTIFRNTARALFGKTESDVDKLNAKVENAVSQLMDFSAKTIFETKDLTGQFVTITANGYDAFADMTATASGQSTKLMSAIADLMTFRSDVPAQQWAIAIRNAFGGQVRSLKSALDINPEDFLGHAWKDGDIAQNFVDLADALGVLGLSGGNFASNIQAQFSNISDIFTKFYLQVADSDVFQLLTQKMLLLTQAISDAFEDNEPLVQSVADALKAILTPLVQIVGWVTSLIPKFTAWVGANPQLVKMLTLVGALAGVFLVVGGVILKVTSALSGLSLFMLTFGKNFGSLGGFIRTGSLKILGVLTPLALTISMLALAWKNDFGDIKTNTIRFGQNIISAFKYAKTGISGNVTDMRTVLHDLMNENPFVSKLATGIMKVTTLFQALCEAWNDNTLSEDTFNKARELGLLPLIETILDIKFRFENFVKGFVEGVKEVADSVINFVSGLNLPDSVTQWFTNLLDTLASSDPQKWQDLGKAVGELATKVFLLVTAFKLVSGVFKVVKFLFSPLTKAFNFLSPKLITMATGFKNLFNVFKGGQGVGVFTKLVEVFRAVASGGISLHDALTVVFGGVGTTIAGVVGVVAGAITSVLSFLDMLKNGFSWVKEALMILGIAIAAVGAIILGAPALVAGIVAGIVAAVATLAVLIKEHWEEIKAFLSKIGGWIMDNIITPVVNFFVNLFNTVKNALVTAWNAVATFLFTIASWVYNNVIAPVVNFFMTYIYPFIEKIVEIVAKVFEIIYVLASVAVQWIYNNVIVPIGQFFSNLWNSIVTWVQTFITNVQTLFSTVAGWVDTNVIQPVATFFTNLWNGIAEKVSSFIEGVKSVFSTFVTWIDTNVIQPITTFFSNLWEKIKTAFDTIADTITAVLKGAINSVLNFIGGIINGVISGINGAINLINKIPGVNISTISPLNVPQLAQGGIVTAPTNAIIGEQGTEAVMPLENNTQWIGVLAKMIRTEMQEIRPTNTHLVSRGSDTNTGGYMTTNNSTSNVTGDTDNSVTFESGAIQITANNSSAEEAERLAKKIMELIKRQKQLDGMMSYA